MKNKTLGLLLLLCLIINLLPVTATADTVSAAVSICGHILEINAYDTPAYTVNTTEEILGKDGKAFTATTQTTAGATEQNWNAKFVWKSGSATPTLYLKGFKVDEYNNETAQWKARYQNEPAKDATVTTAIKVPKNQPTDIVITGADSLIETRFGIQYLSNLSVKSEGDAKLTIYNLSAAITSTDTAGASLNINANLDLSVEAYYNSANSHMIQTYKADLTIEGGNIKITTPSTYYLHAIFAREGGNIHIKGGNIKATCSVGTGGDNGTIKAGAGKIIIDGGEISVTPKASMGFYAEEGIEINGGKVNIRSPYYGMNVGTNADIAISGGTVEIIAEQAFYKAPKLGSEIAAYAGANRENSEVYDGSDANLSKKPWMLLSDTERIEITEPEAEEVPVFTGDVPTNPAPTTIPTLPAATVIAPATQAPVATDSEGSNSSFYWITVAATAIVIIGAIIAIIISKRKKA